MPKTYYVNFEDVTEVEKKIMIFVDEWAREKKTTIPLKEIIISLTKQDVKVATTIKAINTLLKKSYIRRAVAISNSSRFVQLKRV